MLIGISVVMCPDKKYQWFEKNEDWCPEDREKVKQMVFKHWEHFCSMYDNKTVSTSTMPVMNVETATQPQKVMKVFRL
jgi:hypothetical protein